MFIDLNRISTMMPAWTQSFASHFEEWHEARFEIDGAISSFNIGMGIILLPILQDWARLIAMGLIISGSLGCVFSVKRQSTGAKIDNLQTSIDGFLMKMKKRDKKQNKRMKALLAENNRRFDVLKDVISKHTEAITELTAAVAGSGGAAVAGSGGAAVAGSGGAAVAGSGGAADDVLKDDRQQGSETE